MKQEQFHLKVTKITVNMQNAAKKKYVTASVIIEKSRNVGMFQRAIIRMTIPVESLEKKALLAGANIAVQINKQIELYSRATGLPVESIVDPILVE